MLETTKEERERIVAAIHKTYGTPTHPFNAADGRRWARDMLALCRDVNALEEALPEIDLLARAAEALAYHGIEPVSDIEKLRVAAGKIRAVLAPKDREEVADGE